MSKTVEIIREGDQFAIRSVVTGCVLVRNFQTEEYARLWAEKRGYRFRQVFEDGVDAEDETWEY
jgi:hypothetical protein